jgi:putative tryptophan/tyrosine transport system substrate-binding protein
LARLPRVLELSYTSLAMARRQAGYVDGNNVVIQYRWGGNQSAQLPALAAELAHLPVTVLVTSGGDDAVDAARAATSTIPIVTTIGYDPVNGGLVQSLNRPGGNVTGVSVFASDLVPKRVEIAHELAPNAPSIAFLINPANPDSGLDKAKAEAAAKALGQRVVLLNGASENECDAAFESLAQHQAEVDGGRHDIREIEKAVGPVRGRRSRQLGDGWCIGKHCGRKRQPVAGL